MCMLLLLKICNLLSFSNSRKNLLMEGNKSSFCYILTQIVNGSDSVTFIAVLMEILCLNWTLNHLLHLSLVLLSTSQLEMVCNSLIATFLLNSSMTRRVYIHFWNFSDFTATRERYLFLALDFVFSFCMVVRIVYLIII